MGIVEFLGLPPRAVAAAALVVILGAISFTAWYVVGHWFPTTPPEPVAMAYFYDQNNGQLFEAPASLTGPLETSSGLFQGSPAGVRAHVFSCGKCWDSAERHVGWLEAPAEALLAAGVALPPPPQGPEGTCEVVIRQPHDAGWVYLTSREGLKIVEEVQSMCSGERGVTLCQPGDKLLSELAPDYRQGVADERRRAREQQRDVERERPLELEKEKELQRQAEEYIRSGGVISEDADTAPYKSK